MSQTIDNIIYSDDLKTVEKAENEQITTAVIKEGVTTIGEWAFRDCPKLTVTFDGTKKEWEKIEGVEDCKAENVKFNK